MNNHITKEIDLKILNDNGYTVSECGQVISLKGRSPRVLKSAVGSHGYRVVNLRIDGRSSMFCIHRLVAVAYVPVIEGSPIVNHIDGDKLNNHRANLEWTTHSGNIQHYFDNR